MCNAYYIARSIHFIAYFLRLLHSRVSDFVYNQISEMESIHLRMYRCSFFGAVTFLEAWL